MLRRFVSNTVVSYQSYARPNRRLLAHRRHWRHRERADIQERDVRLAPLLERAGGRTDVEIIECIPALTGPPEKAWHVRYLVEEGFLERRDGRYWRAGGTVETRTVHAYRGEHLDLADVGDGLLVAKKVWTPEA